MTDAPGPMLDVTPGTSGVRARPARGDGPPGDGLSRTGAQNHCPLLEEGSCDEVTRAHGVVSKLDLDREYHRRILELLHEPTRR